MEAGVFKCKMCGGNIIPMADNTYGQCDSCGSIETLPKAADEQRAAQFNRGNRFRQMGDFEKALAIYERIIEEDDADAEAHWCCALCRFGIEYVQDPATQAWLPTCHRLSFDSFLDDIDYRAALQYSEGTARAQYQKNAEKIAEVQRGILATSQNEQPFDVFICYKETDETGARTKDSILAQEIYYELTDLGLRVFFSRITMEEKPGVQYEPYIFAALNSAKVMLVIGTKAEYMNAVWVKNEWSRFLALMRKDRSRLLIPCYRDLDPYAMPEQLAALQSYDMSKIGFLQDLIRGVNKVFHKEKQPESAPKAAPVQPGSASGSANAIALLKRGDMALEDGNWAEANDYYDRVLDMDAECAPAYMGKFLASQQCKSLELFLQQYLRKFIRAGFSQRSVGEADYGRINTVLMQVFSPENAWKGLVGAMGLSDLKKQFREQFTSYNLSYFSQIDGCKALVEEGKELFTSDKMLARAMQFAKGAYREQLQKIYAQFVADMDAQVEAAKLEDEKKAEAVKADYPQFLDSAEQKAFAKRESILESAYTEASRRLERPDIREINLAEGRFTALSAFHYKDSAVKAREAHRKQQKLKKAAKQRKKYFIIISAAVVLVAVLTIIIRLAKSW